MNSKYPLLHEHNFTEQFYLRWYDHQRANSPRRTRLATKRKVLLASYHQKVEMVAGVVLLALLIVVLIFL